MNTKKIDHLKNLVGVSGRMILKMGFTEMEWSDWIHRV